MTLIGFILVVLLVAAVLWTINVVVPMDTAMRKLLDGVVAVAVLLWLLLAFSTLASVGIQRSGGPKVTNSKQEFAGSKLSPITPSAGNR